MNSDVCCGPNAAQDRSDDLVGSMSHADRTSVEANKMPPSKSWEKPASVSLSGTQLISTETRGNPITDEAGPKFRPTGASYDTLIAKDVVKTL